MNFAHRDALWLLLATLPLLCGFLFWAWKRKQFLIRQFVQSRLLAQLTIGVSPRLQMIRMAMMVLAVAFLILTVARPQWGYSWEEATQRGRDIVVAIDTSKS